MEFLSSLSVNGVALLGAVQINAGDRIDPFVFKRVVVHEPARATLLQRPLKTAGRFSIRARTASFASSV